jgi:hypothetical protein
MSTETAARVRDSPAVMVLSGTENINRVVRTREFGLVIDRRRKPVRAGSPFFSAPTFMPQPFFEHDILHGLNAAGAKFVQAIHYADGTGLILQYAEGETPTRRQWNSDPQLRREYSGKLAGAMGELAAVSDAATPRIMRPEERGIWPEHLESTAQYGQLMRDRTVLVWNRILERTRRDRDLDWTIPVLREFGGMESVADALAEFELTGDRPLMLLHNDLHLKNIVREPFKIVDWTNGSVGDPLWAARAIRGEFPVGPDRDRFMADLRAALPTVMFHGFEHDWQQYKVLDRQRTRTVAAGLISQLAADALKAASRADTPQARHEAVRPQAEKIHNWSRHFAGHPTERSTEETAELVLEHVNRQLDTTPARRRRSAHRPQTPARPIVLVGPGPNEADRAAKTGPGPRATTPNGASTVPRSPWSGTGTVSSGLAPVATKLPALDPTAVLPPGGGVNGSQGRLLDRDDVKGLRASATPALSPTLRLGR